MARGGVQDAQRIFREGLLFLDTAAVTRSWVRVDSTASFFMDFRRAAMQEYIDDLATARARWERLDRLMHSGTRIARDVDPDVRWNSPFRAVEFLSPLRYDDVIVGHLAGISVQQGDSAAAARYVARLEREDRDDGSGNAAFWLAYVAMWRGDRAKAVSLLDRAISRDEYWAWYAHVEPEFRRLDAYEPYQRLIASRD
jgi:hypothetical protein